MKIGIAAALSLAILALGVSLGNVFVPWDGIAAVLGHKLFGTALPASVDATTVSIVWNLRLPRVLLAFLVGGALTVSGAVMQSVLRNPLASSYTLGVSSGAALGAGLVIVTGFASAGTLTLPLFGFAGGLATVILAVGFASRIDRSLETHTIILTGMVFSLFANGLITLVMALNREQSQRLIFWQMGSFSLKDWSSVGMLAPVVLAGALFIFSQSRELDMLTFGEEQAASMGVETRRIKWVLLIAAAGMTGSAIAFAGVIGFVDLIVPHLIRRVAGASHRVVIPLSALAGGGFMVLCDLAARTVASPSELPVGAVTALIGAPFFAYIYVSGASPLS